MLNYGAYFELLEIVGDLCGRWCKLASKPWPFSSRAKNLIRQRLLGVEIWFSEKLTSGGSK